MTEAPEETTEEEKSPAADLTLEERLLAIEEITDVLAEQLYAQDWALSQMMKGVVTLMGFVEQASDPESSPEQRISARDGAREMMATMRAFTANKEAAADGA